MWKQKFYNPTSLFGPKKAPFIINKCAHIALENSQKSLRFRKEFTKSASVQSHLCLIVSSDLKWNLLIENAGLKPNRVFHMFRRNVSNRSIRATLNLYKSMTVPIFKYASPCYGLSKYVLGKMENNQKRVMKWIDSEEKVNEKNIYFCRYYLCHSKFN